MLPLTHICLSMRASLHGKCVKVGHCARNCQIFRGDVESTSCDFCGHDICEHVIVGIKVLMEGMQALPKEEETSHDAVQLSERRQLFNKPKAASDKILKPKNSGLITVPDIFFLTYQFTVVIINSYFNKLIDFRNERKQSVSAIVSNKPTTESKKTSDLEASRLFKETTVDCIFVDAANRNDKMPLDAVDIDLTKMKGTYFTN